MHRTLLLCALALAALQLGGCNRTGDAGKEAATAPPKDVAQTNGALALSEDEMRQAGIRVQTVDVKAVDELITLTGTIGANQDRMAKVTARLPGRIVSVSGALGKTVRAGQTLAVLQSIELTDARSAYAKAGSEAAVADAALVRAEKLTADDIIPQKDYLRAKADAERARASLRYALDKLRLLDVSPASGSDTGLPVLAPFAGTIIDKKAVVGESTQPDQALFTIADLTVVWLEADIFEKDLGKLTPGTSAGVTTAAYPDTTFRGKLTHIGETMDKTTRTVKARVDIPNADHRLKIGMFATAQLAAHQITHAMVLPPDAVLLVDGRPTVFVMTDKGFVPRTVETSGFVGNKPRITAGLAPGERVAVEGSYTLKARLLKSTIKSDD